MFGTNDLGQLDEKEYEQKTRDVVDKCLDNGTVVDPQHDPAAQRPGSTSRGSSPRSPQGRQGPEGAGGRLLRRGPEAPAGRLGRGAPKFKDVPGSDYEVPTLIARDGVHPSNPNEVPGLQRGGPQAQRLRAAQLPDAAGLRRRDRQGACSQRRSQDGRSKPTSRDPCAWPIASTVAEMKPAACTFTHASVDVASSTRGRFSGPRGKEIQNVPSAILLKLLLPGF